MIQWVAIQMGTAIRLINVLAVMSLLLAFVALERILVRFTNCTLALITTNFWILYKADGILTQYYFRNFYYTGLISVGRINFLN